jgi:hypothetical protein
MPETEKTKVPWLHSDFGCMLWPMAFALLFIWLARFFAGFNGFHVAAILAFAIALLGLRLGVYERLRTCPHGVRGAIASPPLCPMCLAGRKACEHADRVERKRRGRERAEAR